jgi:hypothetical protein
VADREFDFHNAPLALRQSIVALIRLSNSYDDSHRIQDHGRNKKMAGQKHQPLMFALLCPTLWRSERQENWNMKYSGFSKSTD